MGRRTKLGAALLAPALLAVASILLLVRDRAAERGATSPGAAPASQGAPPAAMRPVAESPAAERIALAKGGASADPERAAAAIAPAGAPPARLLRARVVDERGAPLAGATMSFDRDREGLDAASDAAGDVALAVPVDRLRGRTHAVLDFRAADRTSERRWLDLRPEGECHAGEVALLPAGVVVGRVVDDRGAPLRASVVVCEVLPVLSEHDRQRLETLGEGLVGRGVSTRCAEDGSFRVDAAPAGRCAVAAASVGFLRAVSEPLTVVAGEARDAGTLVLRTPASDQRIEGVVLDDAGAPSASQDVELWRPGVARNVEPQVQSTASDAEGRFRFAVPRGASYHVVLIDGSGREELDRIEGVSPGGPALVLRVPPRRVMEVRVSAAGGEPIDDASFGMSDADGHGIVTRPERTAAGTWLVELPARPFRLFVSAPGHAGRSTEVMSPEDAPERIEVALEQARGASIRCLVTRGGEPVDGAQLIAYAPLDGPHRLNTGFAMRLAGYPTARGREAEGAGVHELHLRSAGAIVLLVLEHGRVALEHGPIAVAPGDPPRELELALPPPGRIEGRALLAEGRAPAGLLIGASRGDGEVRSLTLGDDGRYLFDGLAPGDWQVRPITSMRQFLDDRRAYRAEESAGDLVLGPGETARFDVDLRHETPCRVLGRVRLAPDGPGAWRCGLRGEWGEIGADGRFEREVFGPGAAPLVLWASYGPSVELSITAQLELATGDNPWTLDATTAELELTGVPAFEPDVGRRAREPELLRLRWAGSDRTQGQLAIQSHGGGPLSLRGLPPGTWSVETRYAPDGSPEAEWRRDVAEVTLAGGERRTLEL
jgi:hypothetical protein